MSDVTQAASSRAASGALLGAKFLLTFLLKWRKLSCPVMCCCPPIRLSGCREEALKENRHQSDGHASVLRLKSGDKSTTDRVSDSLRSLKKEFALSSYNGACSGKSCLLFPSSTITGSKKCHCFCFINRMKESRPNDYWSRVSRFGLLSPSVFALA